MAVSKPTTFAQFPLLPPELRLEIYSHLLLTPRTIELEFSPPSQTWIPIYYSASSTIPTLLHLTHESRTYALTRYKYIPTLNIWLDPLRDSIYLRLAAGQLPAIGSSAWVFKWWNLSIYGGMDCLQNLVIGEEAWAILREDMELFAEELKRVDIVSREDLFPVWPENEIILVENRSVRKGEGDVVAGAVEEQARGREDRNEKRKRVRAKPALVVKYVNVRRRYKGVLMGGEKIGAFVREETRDPFAVGW